MLMICGFICGPRVKRENGTETEMPGCRMKFELRSKKENQEKNNIEHRNHAEPAEMIFFGAGELHAHTAARLAG